MAKRTESEWENNRRRLLQFFVPSMDDECWPWLGHRIQSGYAYFNVLRDGRRTSQPAYRAVYEAVVGQIPSGLELDHLCRNRNCVNPAHLEPVDRAENIRRAWPYLARGTGHHNGAKTHCPQGHEYNTANTYHFSDGTNRRQCRVCRSAAVRRWRRQQKARDQQKDIGVT